MNTHEPTAVRLLGALLAAAVSVPAGAAEEGDEHASSTSLSPVRIEAGGDPLGRGVASEALQRRQASSSAEIFRGEASAGVGGGSRNAQRLYLRGVESNNLNVTVDGARQGRDLHQHRGGLTGLDPDLLRAADLDPRPAADQGPGALGGSVRFETVDAQDLLDPDEETGARLRAGYASADEAERGSATAFGRLGGDWGALAHIGAVNRDDYRVGGGDTMPYSGGRDRDYLARISRVPASGHQLRLGVQRNTFEGDHHYGSWGSDFGDPSETTRQDPVGQEQRRDTWTAEHRYRPADPHVDWQARVYRNDNRLERQDDNTTTRAVEQGGDLRNTFTLDAGPTRHRLTAGFDYYTEDGRSDPHGGGSRLSHQSRNFGAFVQNRMAWERLRLSAGLRYDDYVTDLQEETLQGDAVSPNFSAEYDLTAGWTAFAGYGEAVSGAGILPIGWLAYIDDEETNLNDGEPFEAEESRRREGGLRYQGRDLITARDRFDFEATLFETRIKNSVERDDPWGTPHQHNLPPDRRHDAFWDEDAPLVGGVRNRPDPVRLRGYELRAAWGVGPYDARLSFLSAEAVDDDGDPVGVIRRLGGGGGDRLVFDQRWAAHETLTLGYTLTWVGDHTDVPDDEPERDGYQLHDVQAEWQPWADDRLTLALAVNNLFDEQYAEHTSLAVEENDEWQIRDEPGRDVRVTGTLRF
ncbi:TonB-dependent receptor domain-containing protein [Halorhodospira halophila]|uniref:TonB-dependent receptor n=1 Tax=Halorhodospira halophila (strain DSM 244 / SL1) TaxID=349124 RepID=A1WYA8_HALHL|nr:TonB-dependent receptor [Halorhodospira halophila]ABM62670.1 TonB-dependent receptor [Halorhodospira halophila SL1]MBK1728351.1 ligand-gated channel protein [Halorhodospira halophila]